MYLVGELSNVGITAILTLPSEIPFEDDVST